MLPRADTRDRLIGADSLAALPRGRAGRHLVAAARPRNCSRAGPTSRSCRSAATSRPGSPRSSAARSTRPCSPRPGSTGSASRPASRSIWLPAPAQGAIGVEIVWPTREDLAPAGRRDRPSRRPMARCGAERAVPRRARRRLPFGGGGAAPHWADGSRDGRDPQPRRPRGPSRGDGSVRQRLATPPTSPGRCSTRPAPPCARCSADEGAHPPPAARRRRDRGAGPRARARAGGRAALRGAAARLDAARSRPTSTR